MKLISVLVALAIASVAEASPMDYAVGEQIVGLVRDEFLDVERGRNWSERHARYLTSSDSADDFYLRTQEALRELGTSHTFYAPKDSVENIHLRSLFGSFVENGPPIQWASIGVDVVERTEGFFVRHVLLGGSAARAGIRRGDRLISADGSPFHPVRSFSGKAGRTVALSVHRTGDTLPFTVSLTPVQIAPKDEWLAHQRASSRIVDVDGARIAYQHVFSCAGAEPLSVLRNALDTELASADALVVDLRDGFGGCGPEFLDVFNPVAPVLVSVDRYGAEHRWTPVWRKPVVLLVNGNTRSGKELVAFAFKRHRVGAVVGERTAGAVVMGRAFPLNDGGLLYLAVRDVRVDGERLEGTGVPVDVEVKDDLPFSSGSDVQLDRALRVAASTAAAGGPPAP